ncbi:MAG TPA: zinc ABC transporter substrate-binding protein [Candidatus Saccharimonadales bacterium]|nr:zinc ABC transporter substrate-binding protein [Candidatus Saccharimonadales bacterium]
MKDVSSKRKVVIASAFILIVLVVVGIFASHPKKATSDTTLQVVAGENSWGSLVSQIGGSKVHVTSVVSDPNADPHEYESNATDARDVATANYVILNGAGYDTWGNKLISASPNSNRRVLIVANLLGKKEGDNPHFWYNPSYVNKVIAQMEKTLISLEPSNASYFKQQYKNLQGSLSGYQNRIASIKKQFGGVKVAATEDIFAYLANAAGLNLVSPLAFTEAVAEGNDPPASSVVQFQQQLQSGQVKALVYNEQTVTPLTTSMKVIAAEQNIPVVGVTETIQPPDTTFQDWMNSELINLENALNANALGQ